MGCGGDRCGLTDGGHQLGEPGQGDVERLTALDAFESDRRQLVVGLLVLADDAGATRESAVDRQIGFTLSSFT